MKSIPRSATLSVWALLSCTAVHGSPSISGYTLSWPDDGWYQVQDAATYESFCEGGLSCEVPAGTYTVINLTTGERFENMIVSGSTGSPNVSGNIISWSDDGWYQVQRADTYESICQGGLSCEVSAGSYNVINLTTGTRYENVIVSENETGAEPASPSNLTMVVYSALSGELMWDRAAQSANIVLYEISRNGNVVGTTDGTSWFEGQLRIDEQSWEVVAIDADGVRSEPASYPDSDSVDEILSQAEDMFEDIRLAFKTTELDAATSYGWRMANTARQLSQGIDTVEFQIAQTDVYNAATELTGTRFDCDSGEFFAHVQGSYEEKPDAQANGLCSGSVGSACEITLVASACVIDGTNEISGNFSFQSISDGDSGLGWESVSFSDYQSISQNENGENTVSMSSGLFELDGSLYQYVDTEHWSSHGLNISGVDGTRYVDEQYIRVSTGSTDYSEPNYSSWAYLTDTLFGGQSLFVAFTPVDYSPENGFAQIGQFTVTSSELAGRELIISNSVEHPDSWNLVLTVNETVRSSTINTAP